MPYHQRVLITCATGTQGGGCVRHCLNDGHFVYALVRDAASAAAQNLERLGARLVQGNLDDEDSIAAAMSGMDAVIFIHPDLSVYENDVQRATKFLNAARTSDSVKTIVASTAFGTGLHQQLKGWGSDHPMYDYWRLKDTVENLVREAEFPTWTILRPAQFLQLLQPPVCDFVFPGFRADRVLRTAYAPETKIPWIDGRDIGLAAAAALTSPELFHGREISLVAEELTVAEIGATIQEALGGQTVGIHFYNKQEIDELVANGFGIVVASQNWANEISGLSDGESVEVLYFRRPLDFFKQANSCGLLS